MLPAQGYPDPHGPPESPGAENSEASPMRHPTQQPLGEAANAAEDVDLHERPAGWWGRFKSWCGVVWHRIVAEFWVEWPLLKPRLLVIVLCLMFQYVHAVFTTLAYHLHKPLPKPLHDIGFEIFPALGEDNAWVTEMLVYTGFGLFGVWLLGPFVTCHKSFHAAVVFKRVLVILVTCQVLRIISFLSTQIPAPNYHCLAGQPTATLPWPDHWWQNIIVNISRQASQSCGDLIFSSHTTFLLVFMWTYAVMGQYLVLKVLAFIYVAATSCLIIASRKHYSVDIVVAWYVVPAFFFHFRRHWTTLRDDVATPDGRAVIANNALPTAAAGLAGAKPPGHMGLEMLLRKLRWGSPAESAPKPPPAAERSASARLLDGQRESEGGEAATTHHAASSTGNGVGELGLARHSPSWVGVDLEAGGANASLNPLYAASPERASAGSVRLIPASPPKRVASGSSRGGGRGSIEGEAFQGSVLEAPGPAPDSPMKSAVRGIISQARALPQRVADGLRGPPQHRRSSSEDDSSRVALRGERGAGSSSADGAV